MRANASFWDGRSVEHYSADRRKIRIFAPSNAQRSVYTAKRLLLLLRLLLFLIHFLFFFLGFFRRGGGLQGGFVDVFGGEDD